jgi:Tfp pilus assembly protein PilW
MLPEMECKITTTKRRRRLAAAGVTLVEMLVAIPIAMLLLSLLILFAFYTSRTFAGLLNYADLEGRSRNAVDVMSREIRQTGRLTDFTTNKLTFNDYDSKPLVYAYDPAQRTLTRTKDNVSTVLLKECDSLNFAIYQRCTTNGTFDQYPTSLQASNCKVVQMSWLCTRKITGAKINSESMQTAKIVIRNQ